MASHPTPDYWQQATVHLSAQCAIMKQLIARYEGESLTPRGDGFFTLLRAVVGQQISVKAADAVWRRLVEKVKPLTPKKLLRTRDTTLRSVGLSTQKVLYAKNVARFWVERQISSPLEGEPNRTFSDLVGGKKAKIIPPRGGVKESDYWSALADDEIIAQLTSIKGIGEWTAEMFLLFHLTRPDVFPVKDLGVLKAIDLHYLSETGGARLKPKQYIAFAERWRPYRSVATWYLWRALDPVPVAY